MKAKTIQLLGLFSVIALSAAPSFAAAKVTRSVPLDAVSIRELRVSQPAIIVSNPFYGLTSFVHDVRDTMTTSRSGKFFVRTEQLNTLAAKLLKMRAVAPDNVRLIDKAVIEYQGGLYQYALLLGRLEAEDFTDEDGGSQADSLINTAITHVRLIDDLLADALPKTNQAVLVEAQVRLADAALRVFTDVLGLDRVADRAVVSDSIATNIRSAEVFSILAKRAAARGNDAAAQHLLSIRGAFLDAVVVAMSAVQPIEPALRAVAEVSVQDQGIAIDLRALAGGRAERLQTISYLLSNAALTGNPELTVTRDQLLMDVFSR